MNISLYLKLLLKSMWNTMECERDGFSGAFGGATETRWERVSHALKADQKL